MITKRNWSRTVDLAFFKKGGTITEGGGGLGFFFDGGDY